MAGRIARGSAASAALRAKSLFRLHLNAEIVDLSQHNLPKLAHSALNNLFSINKIASFPHYAIVRNRFGRNRERETTMAKAATKTKTVAKKKTAAKKPAAKKRAAKRA